MATREWGGSKPVALQFVSLHSSRWCCLHYLSPGGPGSARMDSILERIPEWLPERILEGIPERIPEREAKYAHYLTTVCHTGQAGHTLCHFIRVLHKGSSLSGILSWVGTHACCHKA